MAARKKPPADDATAATSPVDLALPGGAEDGQKNRGGRPSTLTDDVIKEVCQMLATVPAFPLTVAKACGIKERTWYAWLDTAKEAADKPEDQLTHHEAQCLKLAEWLDQADALGEVALLKDVRSGIPGWQGRAWMLQRRFKERWGDVAANDNSGMLTDLVATIAQARAVKQDG